MNGKAPHLRIVNSSNGNHTESDVHSEATPAERLTYMADMLLELKTMAEKGGLDTLSGILEAAYAEAKSHARRA